MNPTQGGTQGGGKGPVVEAEKELYGNILGGDLRPMIRWKSGPGWRLSQFGKVASVNGFWIL